MNIKRNTYILMACSFLLSTSSFATDLQENYIKESILISKDLHQEEKIIQHILDANEQDENPVVLAIQKDKIELAELMLIIRRIELSLGIETFDFPGYSFSRPYGNEGEEAIVWVKKSPITLLDENDRELCFSEAKIDIDILKLLMKYDDQNLWSSEIVEILRHAYQRCDLEGILFSLQLSWDNPNIDLGNAMSRPRYLVDPFLSDFPIDLRNPTHFYNNAEWPGSIPCIWDFRPDDNVIVREIKKQIQSIAWVNVQVDNYQEQIDEIQNSFNDLSNQVQENMDECIRILEDYKEEIRALRQEIKDLEAQKLQESEKYRQKIEELEKKQRESQEIEQALITYGNNPDGMSAFHYAIKQGDLKTVNLLISAGVDSNSRDQGVTGLIRAVLCGQLEIARMLLTNGADVNEVITRYGYADITHKHKSDALYYASISGSSDMVNLLVGYGADLAKNYDQPTQSKPSENGLVTALHLASENGNYEVVIALVSAGADINAQFPGQSKNWKCGTPLDYAARSLMYIDNPENLELVKYLVQNDGKRRFVEYNHISINGNKVTIIPCEVIHGYLQSVKK